VPLLTKRPVSHVPLPVHPVPLGLTYVDPDGQAWALTDRSSGVVALTCAGISGPQPSVTSVNLPGGGALPQSYRPAARTIILGIFTEGATQAEFLQRQDRWTRAIWNERLGNPAPGLLVLARPDGSSRQIQVMCIDGGDQSDDDATKSGLTWSTYALTFAADDPLWADSDAIEVSFGTSSAAGVPPMPPIVLAPATLLGDSQVTNTGDADSYPLWTIHGPGTPTLTNNTTGRSFGLDVTLGDDEVVVVDTRPTLQSAVDQDGDDRWGDLVKSSPRDLWPLVPGVNDLNLSIADSGDGSQVVLSYTRRWLRA
jgi:hypothetical protein